MTIQSEDNGSQNGEEEDGEDGEAKPKGPVKEIGPTLVGAPVASMKDKMIEVIWNQRTMNSSCLICITNYTEKFTLLGLIEMKQRTRKIDKVF